MIPPRRPSPTAPLSNSPRHSAHLLRVKAARSSSTRCRCSSVPASGTNSQVWRPLWLFRENREGCPLLLPADTKRHMVKWLVPAGPAAEAAHGSLLPGTNWRSSSSCGALNSRHC